MFLSSVKGRPPHNIGFLIATLYNNTGEVCIVYIHITSKSPDSKMDALCTLTEKYLHVRNFQN